MYTLDHSHNYKMLGTCIEHIIGIQIWSTRIVLTQQFHAKYTHLFSVFIVSRAQCQGIIWTNLGLLLRAPLKTIAGTFDSNYIIVRKKCL